MKIDKEQFYKLKQLDRIEYNTIQNYYKISFGFSYLLLFIFFGVGLFNVEHIISISLIIITTILFLWYVRDKEENYIDDLNKKYFTTEVKK